MFNWITLKIQITEILKKMITIQQVFHVLLNGMEGIVKKTTYTLFIFVNCVVFLQGKRLATSGYVIIRGMIFHFILLKKVNKVD